MSKRRQSSSWSGVVVLLATSLSLLGSDLPRDTFAGIPVVAPAADINDGLIPHGFPTAASTGVEAGMPLVRQRGDVEIEKDGFILQGLDLEGCVIVRANHVVIRNVHIRCAANGRTPFPVRILDGYTGMLLDSVEIDGMGVAPVAIMGANWSAQRMNIHHVVDGPHMAQNTTLKRSYVHDLSRTAGSHNDALQTLGGSNIVIAGNTLLAYRVSDGDPMNGVLQTGRLTNPLSNVLVEGNFMDGGGYTVRGGVDDHDVALITDYIFENNILGRHCVFGPVSGVGPPVQWGDTNRWEDTNKPVVPGSAAPGQACVLGR